MVCETVRMADVAALWSVILKQACAPCGVKARERVTGAGELDGVGGPVVGGSTRGIDIVGGGEVLSGERGQIPGAVVVVAIAIECGGGYLDAIGDNDGVGLST